MNSLIFIVGKNSRTYAILAGFQNEDTGHISEWFSESWQETHSGEATNASITPRNWRFLYTGHAVKVLLGPYSLQSLESVQSEPCLWYRCAIPRHAPWWCHVSKKNLMSIPTVRITSETTTSETALQRDMLTIADTWVLRFIFLYHQCEQAACHGKWLCLHSLHDSLAIGGRVRTTCCFQKGSCPSHHIFFQINCQCRNSWYSYSHSWMKSCTCWWWFVSWYTWFGTFFWC